MCLLTSCTEVGLHMDCYICFNTYPDCSDGQFTIRASYQNSGFAFTIMGCLFTLGNYHIRTSEKVINWINSNVVWSVINHLNNVDDETVPANVNDESTLDAQFRIPKKVPEDEIVENRSSRQHRLGKKFCYSGFK